MSATREVYWVHGVYRVHFVCEVHEVHPVYREAATPKVYAVHQVYPLYSLLRHP